MQNIVFVYLRKIKQYVYCGIKILMSNDIYIELLINRKNLKQTIIEDNTEELIMRYGISFPKMSTAYIREKIYVYRSKNQITFNLTFWERSFGTLRARENRLI